MRRDPIGRRDARDRDSVTRNRVSLGALVQEELLVAGKLVAPLTGVGFIVVLIISFVIAGEPPSADDPVQEVIDHYVDNKDAVRIGAFVGVAAAILLVFFGAYLRTVLGAAEGAGGMLPVLPLVGTAIVAVGGAIDSTISFALAEAAEDIEPSAVQALQALWDNDFMPLALGTLVFLISAGLSIVRHGGLPKWLGWVALVLAVIGFTPIGFAAFLATAIWIVIVSVMLALRARSATA
jgi:hypothetical protein